MTLKLHEAVPFLLQTCWLLSLDCFSKNKYMNETCAHLLCAAHIPDGRGRVIVMHLEFFTATRSVVRSLGYEAQCA